ncbi:hypothetical protein ACLBPS_23505, partial [Klebsiella pneumoniae]|uniref:hypothetical protein n=1 Tax=Klebsiella pneumoniae TaxID=573 RepID=UPI00396A0293
YVKVNARRRQLRRDRLEKFARHSSSFSVFRRRAGEKVSLLLYRYRSIALGSVWKIDVFDFFIDMCGYLSVVFMRQG